MRGHSVSCNDLSKSTLKPHPKGILEIIKHCPYKTIKYLSADIDGIISANNTDITPIGVILPDSDINTMLNNFKHLRVRHILDNLNRIIEFLEEIV